VPGLLTLELPFDYEEHGERKNALVKVVLCPKCVKKIMWKREQEKKAATAGAMLPGSPEPVPSSSSLGKGTEDEGQVARREAVSRSSGTKQRRSASPNGRRSSSSRRNRA
jgi:protein FRA10AC1